MFFSSKASEAEAEAESKADEGSFSQSQAPPPTFEKSQTEAAAAAAAGEPSSSAFKTQFACVTLNMRDRIRLIGFSEEDFRAVLTAVRFSWPRGISSTGPYAASQEIECKGTPWARWHHGNDDARRTVLDVVKTLYEKGWVMQTAIDISSKSGDKDSMIFRKQNPPPPLCDWLCVSFDHYSKLKIVGNPPRELCEALKTELAHGIDKSETSYERLKLTFHGSPWSPSGKDTVASRQLFLQIIGIMETCGFTCYNSIDITADDEDHGTDVLIIHRQKGWKPGDPIFHR